MAQRYGRRRASFLLVPLAVLYCLGGPSFIATGVNARPSSRVVRHAEEDVNMDALLYSEDDMWKSNKAGTKLIQEYGGAREFWTVFWALVQPTAALGFLVVGISSFVGFPIVNLTPVTKELFGPALGDLTGINPIPQGAFMSFYGFFGFFLFGPLQWNLVINNPGSGLAEFNNKTKRFTVIRDNELIQDVPFSDIEQVRMEWTNLAFFGAREIYVILTNGKEVHFMDGLDELPKRVLERRASQLSEFVGKPLEVVDY